MLQSVHTCERETGGNMLSDISDLQAEVRRLNDRIAEIKRELSDFKESLFNWLSLLVPIGILLTAFIGTLKST
jgi:hypothetical protein